MLRILRAFLWMRWRTSRNAFKTKRSDSLEKIARALATLAPIFMLLLLVPSMIGGSAFAGFVGYQLANAEGGSNWFKAINVGRVLLAILSLTLLIAPMVRSGRGTGSEMTRLMLLPIKRWQLHFGEVIGGLGDPWLAVVIPALLALGVGIAVGGKVAAGVLTVIAGMLFIATMVLAMSLGSFAIALIFRQRQRAEWFTIGLITVLATGGVLLAMLDSERLGEKVGERAKDRSIRIEMPAAVGALPSELWGGIVRGSLDSDSSTSATHALGMFLWVGLLYGASRWTHTRLLETPETGGSRKEGSGNLDAGRALPGVSPTVAAVAWAHTRETLRSVRGKTGVYLNVVVVGLLYAIVLKPQVDLSKLPDNVSPGMGVILAGTMFTLLSLQPIMANAFAADGAGLTLQFLSPLSPQQIVRGKFIAGAILTMISAVLCTVAGIALAPFGSPLLWLCALLLAVAGFLIYTPIAVLLGALLPKHTDLSKMGKDGNAQPIASIIATFATPISFVPSALVAIVAIFGEQPSWVILLLSLGLLMLSAGFALLMLRGPIPNVVERRKENLLLVAGGR